MEAISPNAVTAIDEVFRLVNREVWIVTSADGEANRPRRGGLLATWVAQASLDPAQPLLIAAIAKNHFTAELIGASGSFAAHLISAEQIELAWRFGIGSGRDRDKLAELSTRSAVTGAPVLDDCLAWLDCRVLTTYDAGDRLFFWADVVDGGRTGDGEPLCEQELFAAADASQLAQLRENLLADLRIQKPLLAAWRASLSQPQG